MWHQELLYLSVPFIFPSVRLSQWLVSLNNSQRYNEPCLLFTELWKKFLLLFITITVWCFYNFGKFYCYNTFYMSINIQNRHYNLLFKQYFQLWYLFRNNSNQLLYKSLLLLKLSVLLKQMMVYFAPLSRQYICLISFIIYSLVNHYVHISLNKHIWC